MKGFCKGFRSYKDRVLYKTHNLRIVNRVFGVGCTLVMLRKPEKKIKQFSGPCIRLLSRCRVQSLAFKGSDFRFRFQGLVF